MPVFPVKKFNVCTVMAPRECLTEQFYVPQGCIVGDTTESKLLARQFMGVREHPIAAVDHVTEIDPPVTQRLRTPARPSAHQNVHIAVVPQFVARRRTE
jgi:hypothetical protein